MKTPVAKYPTLAFLTALCFYPGTASAQDPKGQKAEPDTDSPVGVWRGESVCATGAPSCHDEKVVYYIEAIADRPDAMLIRADKIIEEKAITMGSGPWQYDRAKHTLSFNPASGLWLLNINGKRIEGTLTQPNKVVFRRMTLTKSE